MVKFHDTIVTNITVRTPRRSKYVTCLTKFELEEDWCEVVPYACVADDHESIDDEEESVTAAALRYGHVDVPRALHS